MKSGIMDKYWSNDGQKWDKSYPKGGQKVIKTGVPTDLRSKFVGQKKLPKNWTNIAARSRD